MVLLGVVAYSGVGGSASLWVRFEISDAQAMPSLGGSLALAAT